MAQFAPALQKILRHEGVEFDDLGAPIPGRTGYVNHPLDPGGETNYGITKQTAIASGYTAAMSEIPYSTVANIYRANYWNALHGDEIPDQSIAEEMFDTAVNCGVATVVNFLQRTLNALNNRGTRYSDVTVDGQMGPGTVGTLRQALAVAPYYQLCILRALDSLQCVRYINLAERDSKFEVFLPGWLRTRVGLPE